MRKSFLSLLLGLTLIFLTHPVSSAIRDTGDDAGDSSTGVEAKTQATESTEGAALSEEEAELSKAMKAIEEEGVQIKQSNSAGKNRKTGFDRADSFVAGPDWEFDGFVAGAENSSIRSMFYINDLLYLNIGAAQGLAPGERIGLYKRGDKVRDPQTGKFIGYEVRRAAVAKVTDKVGDTTCSVRISKTIEPVELGDLVRRGE